MEPITIYLVEDDLFLLEMYSQRFTQSGYKVMPKINAMEALNGLRSGEKPQVIVTDIMMPGMDGFEFLEIVKKEGLLNDAAIVVLSNVGEDEDIDKAVSLGATGYIVKATSTPSEVVERVSQVYKGLVNPKK